MFYHMITKQRDKWYAKNCPITDIISYIENTNQMRDAQIDAIKTYLYLKIACDNKPLYELFTSGKFNSLNLDELEICTSTREALQSKPALSALYEYCSQTVGDKHISEKALEIIKSDPASVDANKFFKNAFYGVTYTDYLFSLPMGAGKTYLMAAFIYLDLYFAINEPTNTAFAHNFIIFAPSGLKSSVVPSLKTIQNFDPAWILAEPVASELKRKLIFEVLDENKTAKKSNKTKNPNAQKIANHQPFKDLFGLVAVTNAEKVILDRIQEKNGQISFFDESDDERDKQANELRNLIGKLPSLSVFIDEVHHAATDEKKLRAVVNKWSGSGNVNSVIGFSGTPYLQKAEQFFITDKFGIKTEEISNIVYYYRLVDGIGNFLKKPVVYTSSSNSRLEIVESGVRQFLNDYKDKVYADGTSARLGIYCGSINQIVKESFGFLKHSDLNFYNNELKTIFEKITYLQDETGYFSSLFNQSAVRANIRNAFYAKRSFETTEELIPDEASLLHVENFTDEVKTATPKIFTPDADTVEKIIAADKGKLSLSKTERQMLELAKATNNAEIIKLLSNKSLSHPMKNNSFHYLPYKTDSDFEVKFLEKILAVDVIKELNLEVYYNGDRALTEFKIKCYKSTNGKLQYVGMYTPDFLIIKRKDGKIYKLIIVETKGKIYANDPTFVAKKDFTANDFITKNNEKFGYDRFAYLYLEDSIPEKDRIIKTIDTIKEFFTEE